MSLPLAVSLLLTYSIVAESQSSEQYKCDDPNFNVLMGKFCYRIEDRSSYISAQFEDQRNICENLHGYLASFANLDDQNQLLNRVLSSQGVNFTPFYIGLYCDVSISGNEHWTWENPNVPYDATASSFKNPKYGISLGAQCSAEDADTHFVLNEKSQWVEILPSTPPGQFNVLVCQKTAIVADIEPSTDDYDEPKPTDPPSSYDDTNLVIGLAITCGILVICIIFMMIRFRKKIKELMSQMVANSRNALRKDSANDDAEKTTAAPKDEWELGRQFVNIQYSSKLGTGAFGVVYLGEIDVERLPKSSERSLLQVSALKLDNGRVAVKMLHESADKLAEVDFLQEIEMMKRIGYHERLVNIIAAVTESLPHLLITEYCCHGDLLSYLKERREYMLHLSRDADYSLIDHSLVVTQEQQLQFAVQIAYGLEFLSGRGFVHRDIAARNILVDERNGCKIGDFGLCRRVQEEQELYLSRGGRLPIKWMSPEALRRYEMSTASDVWSYGILLFEIITLGGSPYPNWAPAEILPRLEAGERMDRPDNCPDAVFEAMSDCWCENPMKRPDFTTLRCRLAKALEESPSEYYLQLDAQRDYYLVPRSRDLPIPEEEFIRII